MRRTRVKICGITRPEDALAAAECGADAIGLVVHAESRRTIDLNIARQTLDLLPPFVTPVLLFVDAPADHVLKTARKLGVRHVQLHGSESPEMVAELSDLVVIKALRVEKETFADEVDRWRRIIGQQRLFNLKGIVLETPGTPQHGGTGIPNDWPTVIELHKTGRMRPPPHFIMAGGLTPQTVTDVVRALRPWGVDVSSGVESTVGVKSRQRIMDFITAVRSADEA